MNQEYVIEVENVKKKFKVYFDKGNMLKERIIFRNRNRFEERWVLKGISFKVKKGEAVGLIGYNGCGKSTTLKLLSKIMYPDEGTITMNGRVSSLIELGAGFHPDMSGRENIYINASIFGLGKKEIDARLNDIIEFSELEEFIDNPVRTYSSGMYMRLAFSVAINVDADILLIDEILAVGDVNFQAKCFEKLMEIKEAGTTIVIVSHSMDQIESICDTSIWIHEGLIVKAGPVKKVDHDYLEYMEQRRKDKEKKETEKNIEKILKIKTKSIEGKEVVDKTLEKMGVFLYLDKGYGFNQKDVIVIDSYVDKNGKAIINENVKINSDIRAIRIDPVEGRACQVNRFEVSIEVDKENLRYSKSVQIGSKRLFMDTDPQIIVNMGRSEIDEIELYAEYEIFPEEKVVECIESIIVENERLRNCLK